MNRILPDPFYQAFRPLPEPAFLFESVGHARALTMLEFAIEANQAIAVLTGDVGTGKTLLLRVLVERYRDQIEFGLLGQDGAELVSPLRWVLRAFGQDHSDAPTIDLLTRLNGFISECQAKGRRVMLIADEAQTLSVEELDQLRQLTDLHAEDRSSMPLLLVGQPALRDLVNHHDSRALRSRIGGQYVLPPLGPDETSRYVVHRLAQMARRSPGEPPHFDAEALALLHAETGGVPLAINHLAQRCLFAAERAGLNLIDADVLRASIRLDWTAIEPAPPPPDQTQPVLLVEPRADPEPEPPAARSQEASAAIEPIPAARQLVPLPAPQFPARRRKRLGPVLAALAGVGAVTGAAVLLIAPPETPPAPVALTQPPPAPQPSRTAAAIPPLPRVSHISAAPDPKNMLITALGAEAVDTAQAAMLYERAALWGSARAAYYTGQYYEAGLGVPVDLQRAEAWYRKAEGVAGAEARLSVLADLPQPAGQLGQPDPVMQMVFPTGHTELHWRGSAQESPAGFVVEYQQAGGASGLQRAETRLSAMLLDRPIARWRLIAKDAGGREGQPGAWIEVAPPPR